MLPLFGAGPEQALDLLVTAQTMSSLTAHRGLLLWHPTKIGPAQGLMYFRHPGSGNHASQFSSSRLRMRAPKACMSCLVCLGAEHVQHLSWHAPSDLGISVTHLKCAVGARPFGAVSCVTRERPRRLRWACQHETSLATAVRLFSRTGREQENGCTPGCSLL